MGSMHFTFKMLNHGGGISSYQQRASLRLVITCGSKTASKSGKRSSSKSGSSSKRGGSSYQDSKAQSQPKSLAQLKADEIRFFNPVAPPKENALQVVYAYPNEYSVGITSLGYQLVWAFFETHPLCAVSRMFTDVSDSIPSSSDLIGFSLAWELDYSNLMSMLEQLGIPLLAADRDDSHPLVFGGGPVLSANPEPFAPFFDIILVGDGEELLGTFTDALIDAKKQQGAAGSVRKAGVAARGGEDVGRERRLELLEMAAAVPGVYVPVFYNPVYESATGPLLRVETTHPDAPQKVIKQTYRGNTLASSTVVSPHMAWDSIFMAEVVRSCPEMCRFCLASYLTLPFRPASLEGSLIPIIERGLTATSRIGLLGASVTQHPEFPALLDWLLQPERDHIRLSISSVRTNTVTPELASALSSRGTRSLTVAVESGSERVRKIVNKKLSQEEVIQCAINAQEGGLEALKLYGMVGVPGEEESDVDATIQMLADIKKAAPKLRLTFGCSTFVPKAHTPFQWYGVDKDGDGRLKRLEKALGKQGVDFRPESFKWSIVQALISRGDRRLVPLLIKTRELGDSLGSFKRVFKEMAGEMPPMDWYVYEDYVPGSVLPWSHLQGPLPEGTLIKHLEEAQSFMDRTEEVLV